MSETTPDKPTCEPKSIDVNSHFYRYLIDMKYALRECDFDDGVNIGEKQSTDKEKHQGEQFERVLLANVVELVDMLYSPSMTYSRVVSIVRLSHIHDANLLHMVNRSDFQRQVGKPISNRIRDTQIAISLLGIEGAKALLPIMMIKQTIKLRNEYFPLVGFKLWKLLLSNGLAAHHTLTLKNAPDPVEGLIGGMLFHLGKISIYHQFINSFDDVKKNFLIPFRNDGKKAQHDFLLKVEPDAAILFHLMASMAKSHTLSIVQYLQMQMQKVRPKGLSSGI